MAKRVGCLTPGCHRKHRAKGLCKVCYECARVVIARGDNSWEGLEKAGMALPRLSGRQLRRSKFRFDAGAALEKQSA